MLRILRVRVYKNNLLYDARSREISIGEVWICTACNTGELGLEPATGDFCPHCGARVEEVIPQSTRW